MKVSNTSPNIAVIVVCTNEMKFLRNCLSSLNRQTYKKMSVILVDNASSDGSAELAKKVVPTIKILTNPTNFGFAKSNNLGMDYGFDSGADLCFILNPDTIAEPTMLEELVNTYIVKSQEYNIGLIQPLLLLNNNRNRINSAGNPIHYLGYGYAGSYYLPRSMIKHDREILSATGGALLITKNFYLSLGGFDENFFMYCEDQNMCWKGYLLGYKYFISHKSIVYHKYQFNRNSKKLFYAERNRLFMLAENYSARTLFLIFPYFLVNECGVLLYSIYSGWFVQKVKSYISFLLNLSLVMSKRHLIQSSRVLSDRAIFNKMQVKINFLPFDSFFIRIANRFYSIGYKTLSRYVI